MRGGGKEVREDGGRSEGMGGGRGSKGLRGEGLEGWVGELGEGQRDSRTYLWYLSTALTTDV